MSLNTLEEAVVRHDGVAAAESAHGIPGKLHCDMQKTNQGSPLKQGRRSDLNTGLDQQPLTTVTDHKLAQWEKKSIVKNAGLTEEKAPELKQHGDTRNPARSANH